MNKRILYVEDDETLGFVTKDNLIREGYDVTLCKDGQIAKNNFKNGQFDICIVDVMLPKLDGFELATYIREVNTQIPIIFVTAKSMQEDKIKGLQIGADDYITKPFSIEELVLKINIFLKRKFINDEGTSSTVKIGNYTLDANNLKLTLNGADRKITQRECELLQALASKKNEIVKRKFLLESIWGKEDYFLGRSMDVFISRLRKHLSEDPKVVIENVHGVGFRLTDE